MAQEAAERQTVQCFEILGNRAMDKDGRWACPRLSRDNGGVVDLAYERRVPYAFTGTVKQVVFDLKPVEHEHPLQGVARTGRS